MAGYNRIPGIGRTRSIDIRQTRAGDFPPGSGAGAVYLSEPGPGQVPVHAPPADAGYVRTQPSPWTEKLGSQSRDFRASDFAIVLPAVAGSQTTSAQLRFALPGDQVGWLQQNSIYILVPVATTRVLWTIRINGGPVSGFDNIRNPPGAANFILINDNDMRVRVPQGATVDMLITNEDGAAVTVGGKLAGWYHPRQLELRNWGEDV